MADDLDAEFALFQAELANVEAAVEAEKEENADERPQTEKLPPPPVPPPISSSPTDADLPLPEPAPIKPLPRPAAAAPQIISAPPQIAAPPQPYQPPTASETLSPQQQHQYMQQQQHYGYMPSRLPGGMPLDPNNQMMSPDRGSSLIGQQQPTKKVGIVRQAAGEKWVDPTLIEWPENDYRIFVGNLGPEVNDTMLAAAFQHYSSFTMAKVVREKWKNKSRGYGFVSFQDPLEGGKVLREMDKKYIGNRPCNLKKSTWDDRNVVDNKTGKARKRSVADKSGKVGKRPHYDYDQQQQQQHY